MGFADFFRRKNSGEVAKDRLKLLAGDYGGDQK